jgi:DpnII restriction endonuclease
MKFSDDAKEVHRRIDWSGLRDLREIEPLAARTAEVLKGIRMAGISEFVSSNLLHQIIYIQAGKRYSSTPSHISSALQRSGGSLEREHTGQCLKFRFPTMESSPLPQSNVGRAVDDRLLTICERFHRAIIHLSHRRKGRAVIDFADEYDVQDVFGTVLKCSYDDVRDEEWTPSYAGKAAKIDFVVADTRTATELKRARPRQKIADELIIDIARYAKRGDVDNLVCFVYDPDGLFLRDAAQTEKDLSGRRSHDNSSLDVTVLVRPK